MMFFLEKKIIFVHIPKTGGSTLEYSICESLFGKMTQPESYRKSYAECTVRGKFKNIPLRTRGGHTHSFIREYAQFLPIESFLKFTVLRDPFKQVVSLYNQMRKPMKIPSLEHFVMTDGGGSMKALDDYIDQYKYTHIDGVFAIDKPFVFERYGEAQAFVESQFGIKIDKSLRLWKTSYTDEVFTKEMTQKFESVYHKSIDLHRRFL